MTRKTIVSLVLLLGLLAFAQAEVVYSEDFEGNWEDDWYADFGTWEVGTPTSGPGAAYGGSNCLATILAGYYPSTALSKFIKITPILVPPASQHPRLRFQNYFSFNQHANDRDHGRMLIRPAGSTTWTQLGDVLTVNSGGIWFNQHYDLTEFAGQMIQIAFEVDVWDTTAWPYDDPNEDPGWYIDDIHIETGTPVFNNPETWENGIGDWFVTKGTWEVGVPTSGPGSSYGGANCLATRLGSNYWGRVNSRIVSPPTQIPSLDQNPRLRFQTWYVFNQHSSDRDHGKVLIKTAGSQNWSQLGVNITVNSGGIWFKEYYDLAEYAGQVVQIAFELDVWDTTAWPYDDPNEDPGWYIDNIMIETGPRVFNNPENWENGMGDWYASKSIWQVGAPTSGPGSGYQSTNCAATILNGNYPARSRSRLTSPSYHIPAGATNLALRFRHWYNVAGGDTLYVQIKESSSTVWQNVSGGIYTGNSGGVWATLTYVPLPDIAGQNINLGFYLATNGGSAPGWYIDNIVIQYTVSNPAPVAIAPTTVTQSGFRANWNVVSGALSYRLDVSTSSGFSSFVPGYQDLNLSTNYCDVSGVNPGCSYYYRIRAVHAAGLSDNSNLISVLTLPPNPVAANSSNLSAISFQANWAAATSATSYRLDVATDNGFAAFVSGYQDLTLTDTQKLVSGLMPDTWYYYRVRAVNASGVSGNSNMISVHTPEAPPKAPQNLLISTSGSNILLSWDPVTQSIVNTPMTPDYYLIYQSTNPHSGFGFAGVAPSNQYTHLMALNFSSRLFYQVHAYKSSGRVQSRIGDLKPGMSHSEVLSILEE